MESKASTWMILCACCVVVVAIAGCPESAGRPSTDAGADLGTEAGPPDSAVLDASTDGGGAVDGDVPDSSVGDGGDPLDGSVDAALVDGYLLDAVVPDASADGGADSGTTVIVPVCAPGVACGAGGACPMDTTCVVNACGAEVCQPRAAFCMTDAECHLDSTCVDTALGPMCTPGNGEVCNASTDCPPSHQCEGPTGARACLLRRILCDDEGACPVSYTCSAVEGDAYACRYAYRPCDSPGTCDSSLCLDLDGDGRFECGGASSCLGASQCSTSGERCMLASGLISCGFVGLCNQSGAGACPTGYRCADLAGDGYGECLPEGGSCSSSSECPTGQRCVVPTPNEAPRCVGL